MQAQNRTKLQAKPDFWELCHCNRYVPAPNSATHQKLHAQSVNIVKIIK